MTSTGVEGAASETATEVEQLRTILPQTNQSELPQVQGLLALSVFDQFCLYVCLATCVFMYVGMSVDFYLFVSL